MKKHFLLSLFALSLVTTANAQMADMNDDLDPTASNINEILLENDLLNAESRVKENTFKGFNQDRTLVEDCYRESCAVYIEVDKATQRATIRINGELMVDKSGKKTATELRVTTGSPGHETPNFDRHPEQPLRAYHKYSSSKYPGGNWIGPDGVGYGNMPFVVFIKGGYGVHGTTGTDNSGNIAKLGTVPLSHGCVRIHPLNAKAFNAAVAKYGAANTWIHVHD
jgi:hypothetical protein